MFLVGLSSSFFLASLDLFFFLSPWLLVFASSTPIQSLDAIGVFPPANILKIKLKSYQMYLIGTQDYERKGK